MGRSRDATPAIRGIKYQCDWSILTWIGLDESTELLCETDEDWKTQLADVEVLYQAGVRERNLTLNDGKILQTIYDFTRYSLDHPERTSRFVFVSNASIGQEHGEHEALLGRAVTYQSLELVASRALNKIRDKCSAAKDNRGSSYWRNARVDFNEADIQSTLLKIHWLLDQPDPEDIETEVLSRLNETLGVVHPDGPVVYALLLSQLLRIITTNSISKVLRLNDARDVVASYHQNREEWIGRLRKDELLKRVLALPAFEGVAEKLALSETLLRVAPALAQALSDQLLRNAERRHVAVIVNDHRTARLSQLYRQYDSFTEDKLKTKICEVISDVQQAEKLFVKSLAKREAMWTFKERLQATPSGAASVAEIITETYSALERYEGVLPEVEFVQIQMVLGDIVTKVRQIQLHHRESSIPSDVVEGIIHDLSGRCAFRWGDMKSRT